MESFVHRLRVETDPRIVHAGERAIAFVWFGPDQRVPGAIMDGIHRVRTIPEEVLDYLRKLDSANQTWHRLLSRDLGRRLVF